MTVLAWDQVGQRTYQTGVDRGVLYTQDGTVAVWNGLTSIEENNTAELKSYYLDGIKYLDNLLPGDFSGTLKAFTYPEEFDAVNGILEAAPGLFYYDQPSKSFNLSYRTRVGNDLDGMDYGYKVHLLYNVVANPDVSAYETLKDQAAALEFSWALTGTPPKITGARPTVHVSIDSKDTSPEVLKAVEDILYGTDISDPHFPPMNELFELFVSLGVLIIIDNGDGTWQAVDNGEDYITMLDDTTFQIDNADATFLDSVTYQISTTYSSTVTQPAEGGEE